MNRIPVVIVLGLALFLVSAALTRSIPKLDCGLLATSFLLKTPVREIGYPSSAFTSSLSDRSCHIENPHSIFWDAWKVNYLALLVDLAAWLVAASLLVYGYLTIGKWRQVST